MKQPQNLPALMVVTAADLLAVADALRVHAESVDLAGRVAIAVRHHTRASSLESMADAMQRWAREMRADEGAA